MGQQNISIDLHQKYNSKSSYKYTKLKVKHINNTLKCNVQNSSNKCSKLRLSFLVSTFFASNVNI